jgi:hypothetical protein
MSARQNIFHHRSPYHQSERPKSQAHILQNLLKLFLLSPSPYCKILTWFLLVLDGISESADEFVVHDFDGKNLAGVIALDKTVEFEDRDYVRATLS